MKNTQSLLELHLLTNCNAANDNYLRFIKKCILSGVTHVQLRQKNWSYQDLLHFGYELKNLLKPYNTKLIINDNLKLAIALDADGIHLGQTDCNYRLARIEFGTHKIIGLSIESHAELLEANKMSEVNYVAASAVFASKSKNNLKKIWGINGLNEFCKISKHPVIAIGGIDISNIKEVVATGINGIAIISAIHNAYNPQQYIQQLLRL